jgi:hypothetical protein
MFSDPNNKAFSVRPPSLDQFRLSSIAVFVPAMPVRAVVLNSEYVANLQRKDHINPKPFTSNVSLHVEFAIAKHIIKQSEDLALNFESLPGPRSVHSDPPHNWPDIYPQIPPIASSWSEGYPQPLTNRTALLSGAEARWLPGVGIGHDARHVRRGRPRPELECPSPQSRWSDRTSS